jgi:hypothetical protein
VNDSHDPSHDDPSRDDPHRDDPHRDAPTGTGVSLDELADLHAGLLTTHESDALRARIRDDPAAAELLAALDRTVTVLGELQDEPIPDDVAARVDTALRAEITQSQQTQTQTQTPEQNRSVGAEVLDLAAARNAPRTKRDGRPRRWLGPVLALSAAAAVAVIVAGGVLSAVRGPDPQAGSAPVAPALTAAELSTLWPGIRDSRDLSFLDVPGKLERCVLAADPAAEPSKLLGARPVVLDGQYGVAVAVPSYNIDAGPDNEILLVVLGPGCAATADVIAQTYIPD